jgi:hypothetical protein
MLSLEDIARGKRLNHGCANKRNGTNVYSGTKLI